MSVDGFELTFATNHLGPFLLTALLSDPSIRLRASSTVASRIHFRGAFDLDTVTNPVHATGPRRLCAVEARQRACTRSRSRGGCRAAGICVNCLHPGVVATNLLPRWLRVIKPLLTQVMLDAERGARTSLYLALEPSVAGVTGRYFDSTSIPSPRRRWRTTSQLQESLWKMSAQWTGAPG